MAAHGFNQELRQKQTQSQVLAPQLRHSLKILQVAAQDLRTTIQEELQTNPSVEELPMESVSLDDSKSNDTDSNASSNDDSSDMDEVKFDETFEILNKLDQDWRDHFAEASSGGQRFTSEDAERREHFFNSLVTEESFQEHLLSQATMADIPEAELKAIEYIIGSLDNNGFLTFFRASHS